jgi:phenylalanyl-tRNA synthetase beta chain
MLISQNWLREFVDFTSLPEEVEQILTMLGLEVENIDRPGEKLRGFVVGEILTREKHPNADKLSVCTVAVTETGASGAVNTIVCGAPNVAAGQKVAVALGGAVVPNGGFIIEKRKLRGIESNGMICSKAELGLGTESDGIWELPADAPVGQELAVYLGIDDVIYDISITPNRSDCLSHLGIAREIAAYFNVPLRKPGTTVQEDASVRTEDCMTVRIEETGGCHRFAGRIVRGVRIGESPKWLKDRITACGLRSINNVVDVTNYVMLECGKPIHAFDVDTIVGATLVIKSATEGEKFTTLDGKERTLTSMMVMVADAEKNSAVGGIMGGLYSEITEQTVSVLIESAYFHPSSVRKTAKTLGITSDAAYRFERGVDMEIVVYAADRAAELIQRVAGGSIASGVLDVYPVNHPEKQATVRFARSNALIGKDIPAAEVQDLLVRLGFTILQHNDNAVTVRIPTYRVDVETETDVIEEIARLHGYDNIQPALVSRVNLSGEQTPKQYAALPFTNEISNFLRANGFVDIVTQNMIDPKSAALFTNSPVRIANPLGDELSCMRPSLVPSMLRVIERNCRYGQKNLRLFECGATFHTVPIHNGKFAAQTFIGGVREERHCIVAMTGKVAPHKYWNGTETDRAVDFYDVKGVLERIVSVCGLANVSIAAGTDASLHTVFSANVVELRSSNEIEPLGIAGEIAPGVLKIFDVETPVFVCMVNMTALANAQQSTRRYAPVSPFPTVARDVAFVLDEAIEADVVRTTILANGGAYLRNVRVFDVFEGKTAQQTLGNGKKSLAFALEFNAADRTLEEADVESSVKAIVASVTTTLSANLRGN